ncbi:MAG TPA: hypothetical protein VNL35_15070 [Chloroflexota bacterium]|nr:hypothetical protein [Chloroflexota bacterium]
MSAYYRDTSALVKRYAREAGTEWATALLDPAAGNIIYTVRLTGPEIAIVSADSVQRNAAAAEGLPVIDPNVYS